MYFKIDNGGYAECDFEPQNAVAEIDKKTYDDGVSAIIANAQAESDDATEEDFLEALTDLGVIP